MSRQTECPHAVPERIVASPDANDTALFPVFRRDGFRRFRPTSQDTRDAVLFLRRINPDFFAISVCILTVLILYYIDCSCSFPSCGKEELHLGRPHLRRLRVERMLSRTMSVRQNKRLKEHGHERSEPYEFQADALWHPRLLVSASVIRSSCIRHETTTFRVPRRDAVASRGRIHESLPCSDKPTWMSSHSCWRFL